MELNHNWDWTTHKPVLKFFIGEYGITKVIEHGTGMHSTPILNNESVFYYGFEESKEFREMMIKEGVYKPSQVVLFPIPDGMEIFTRFCDLGTEKQEELRETFLEAKRQLYINDCEFNLLMVDGFSASRNVCINTWYDLFDIIVYHDCEPNSVIYYEYDFVEDLTSNYDHYKVTTDTSWTGFFIKKGIIFVEEDLRKYVDEYCEELNMPKESMQIIKQ